MCRKRASDLGMPFLSLARIDMHSAAQEARQDFALMLSEFGLTERDMRRLQELGVDTIEFSQNAGVVVAPSQIAGRGLFAIRCFAAGEMIAPARIGDALTPAGRYTNHAKQPNARFDVVANGDVYAVALRDIAAGEEITNDYRRNARVLYAVVTACPLEKVTRTMVSDAMHAALQSCVGEGVS